MQDPNDFCRDLFALVDRRDGTAPVDAAAQAPAPPEQPAASPVSLMITKRQRAELKALGFSDEAVADMTPAVAHRHLGL